MRIKVGCCGFGEAQEAYSSEFPVVEIQRTFYQPSALETAGLWRERAPRRFEFTVKNWQLVTHEASSPTSFRSPVDHFPVFAVRIRFLG
jgi:uncharacterized protein YecE (DUF72 family)